jgi:hypothetical protein
LNAEFANGTTVELPITWVSEPIDAGFFFYEVTEANRVRGMHLTNVVALDDDGKTLARENFPLPDRGDLEHPVTLPDGRVTSLPRKAIVAKARLLISFVASTGARYSLWLMPTTEGGYCFVHNRGGGCPPVGWKHIMLGAGLGGGRPVIYSGQVRPEVAVVELRFEDGTTTRLEPVEGFLLAEIGPERYPRGRRLLESVALGADGRVLARNEHRPDQTGVYPCDEPVDIGRGVMSCP